MNGKRLRSKRYSEQESAEARRLYRRGVPIEKIAQSIGRDFESVQRHLHRKIGTAAQHYVRTHGWASQADVERDARRQKMNPTIDDRDLTGVLMGDPIGERSALAGRASQ